MQRSTIPPSQDLIAVAEQVLSKTFGSTIELDEGQDLHGGSRTNVYRFSVLNGPSDAPKSVIVKQVKTSREGTYDPDRATIPAWTFFNEWASLQFLSEISENETSFAPRFCGGDRATGLIVMEDLGPGKRLDELLMGNDPTAAETALIEFATTHGKLHASTIGRQEEFNRLRRTLGPDVLEDDHYTYDWLAPTFYQTCELLDIAPESGVEAELAMLKASMVKPGSFLTFVQRDSCPDNCLFTDAGLRLLDLEGGMFDSALVGGVYGRMRFPTCLCVYQIPDDIIARMEASYRTELVKGCLEAANDTRYYHALVEACVHWMIEWYRMDPLAKVLEQDRLIATATDRQRYLMRSDTVVKTIKEFEHMQAIGATIRSVAAKMGQLWSDVEETPYYPAFR